jgi:hypothetical protein
METDWNVAYGDRRLQKSEDHLTVLARVYPTNCLPGVSSQEITVARQRRWKHINHDDPDFGMLRNPSRHI